MPPETPITVLSILAIVNVVGNSLVCIVILRNRDMRIPINYLLLNLAVADIVYVTLLAPKMIFHSTFTHPEGVIGTLLCRLVTAGNFGWVGGACSAFTLLAVAIERYYSVMYPLGNKGKLTKRKVKVIVTTCWISALIVIIPDFLVFDYEKKIGFCVEIFPELWMGKAYSMAWLLVMAVIPLAVMTGLYSSVVYALWFKRDDESVSTSQQKGVLKVRKRVTLMVVTVSVIFGVSWGTSSVVYLLSHFTPYNFLTAIAITNIMVFFNSAVNPVVYALVNQRFRQKLKAMICCCRPSANKIHVVTESLSLAFQKNCNDQRTAERVPEEPKINT